MKLYFLGTCSGTEPMPARHHASVMLETGDRLFLLDAGESCSHTAHTMGLDLLKLKHILISHCHIDHVGGLANLFFVVNKLRLVRGCDSLYGDLEVFLPEEETFLGALSVLGARKSSPILSHPVHEGLLLDDGAVKITAFKTSHLTPREDGSPRSFSYRIEAEGKVVVYSGDVGHKGGYAELDAAIGEGCDALLLETGHFSVEAACDFAKARPIRHLYFTHHGREILNSPDGCRERIRSLLGERATVAEDRDIIEL